jgi:hypothetical protein
LTRSRHAALAALWIGLMLALALASTSVLATCPKLPANQVRAADASAFAGQVETYLDQEHARLAIVFRVGLPPGAMPDAMLYSHGGLWVREEVEGGWRWRTFNLYQGDGRSLSCERSSLVEDTPVGFFTGSVAPPRAAVIIPTGEMQARLLDVLRSPVYPALHNPDYSLMANPFEPRHQNCTDFLLRIVVAARLETRDADLIDATIRKEFKPTVVRLNPLVRAFGSVIDGRLTLDDQHGSILTASYSSLVDYMRAKGLLAEAPEEVHTLVASAPQSLNLGRQATNGGLP